MKLKSALIIAIAIILSGCGIRVGHDEVKFLNVEECRYDYELTTYIWYRIDVVSSIRTQNIPEDQIEIMRLRHETWGAEEKVKVQKCLDSLAQEEKE